MSTDLSDRTNSCMRWSTLRIILIVLFALLMIVMFGCSRTTQGVASDNDPSSATFISLWEQGDYLTLFSQLMDSGGAERTEVSFDTLRYVALSGYMVWEGSGHQNPIAQQESIRALERARLLFASEFEATPELIIVLARYYSQQHNDEGLAELLLMVQDSSEFSVELRSLALLASIRKLGVASALQALHGDESWISEDFRAVIEILRLREEGGQFDVERVAKVLGLSPNDEILVYKVLMNHVNAQLVNKEYDQALMELKQFEKSVRSTILRASALYQISRVYRSNGNLIEASSYANRAKELDPQNPLFTSSQP